MVVWHSWHCLTENKELKHTVGLQRGGEHFLVIACDRDIGLMSSHNKHHWKSHTLGANLLESPRDEEIELGEIFIPVCGYPPVKHVLLFPTAF